MHVKFEHIYVIDCSQWSISQAASGVYRGCKSGLVQAWVDLCLCSQVFLHVICPEHPHTPLFFLISKLQIFSQTGWHSAWAIIAVHFKLSLSPRPALTVRLLGIKTGGASPSCGLMHYYIGLCSYCFKLCPVISAFFFFLFDNRTEAASEPGQCVRICISWDKCACKGGTDVWSQQNIPDALLYERNVELCDWLWSWRQCLREKRKKSMSELK